MAQPFKLFRLQQIDSQLDQIRSRLQGITTALADHTRVNTARVELDAAEKVLGEAKKNLQKAEFDASTLKIKIEQTEASLYGGKVHNPKELQDLEKESAALKRRLVELEELQLERMLALEEVEAAHRQAAEKLQAGLDDEGQNHLALEAEQAGLLKDQARLEQERQAAASSIEAGDLRVYDQLRQQRRGVAVARVTGNACGACGSTLTLALVQAAQAHSPRDLARCSFCGRILYATEQAKPDIDDSDDD